MDDWEKFDEPSLPETKGLYSHLNMEDITDEDYAHAKGFCKCFWNSLEIYKTDAARFLTSPW